MYKVTITHYIVIFQSISNLILEKEDNKHENVTFMVYFVKKYLVDNVKWYTFALINVYLCMKKKKMMF